MVRTNFLMTAPLLMASFCSAQEKPNVVLRPGENAKWELYNLNEDRSEQHNLADKYPEKKNEMVKAYEEWAKRCMVEPYPGQKKK